MTKPNLLHVAALIDLPRSESAGGHVKCWERIACAAASSDLPLDLTLFFSGDEKTEILGDKARLCQLPPVFSTARLGALLPYVPDDTDLAPFHAKLAKKLSAFDVVHTTDGFFAFARTAEKLRKKGGPALVTSFHTDTPSYARIFTKRTIDKLARPNFLRRLLNEKLALPARQEAKMVSRLQAHLASCNEALVTREEDQTLSSKILGQNHVHMLRLGIDRAMFGPHKRDREGIEATYNLPKDQIIALFVGRLDEGKNIYTLIGAAEKLIAEGLPFHLLTAGIGPAADDLKARLGTHVTVAGFVPPDEVARLYASVDLLALTSEVEIRSMAGGEAMASACPVLVSEKSGIAALFNRTEAMEEVKGGIDPWADALRRFIKDPALRARRRAVAEAYGRASLASWRDVLSEDLLPVWQKAFQALKG